LNEVHRKISIGGAPSLSGAGSANVHLSCSAYSAKVDTGLAKEYAQFNELEHFLTAIRIPLCRKMLVARIWRSYTA
jgi:hypothetical protein